MVAAKSLFFELVEGNTIHFKYQNSRWEVFCSAVDTMSLLSGLQDLSF